jgi:hypothetical protein
VLRKKQEKTAASLGQIAQGAGLPPLFIGGGASEKFMGNSNLIPIIRIEI